MTQYQEILKNIRDNKCTYENQASGVLYVNRAMMKICADGSTKFFTSFEKMARSINKFIKTGC